MIKLFRILIHSIIRARKFNNRCLKKFACEVRNKKILELGSGKKSQEMKYSYKGFFDNSNDFVQSDINKEYEHKVIDATKIDYQNKFDIILCMNVLEHVFDFHKAIDNIYKALVSGGVAIITVPIFYPLHAEPNDYWRFTEYSLRKLLKKFSRIKIKRYGIRQYPFAYYIEAKK